MEACEQTKGLNTLQHGQAVHESYKQLIAELESGDCDCKILTDLYARYKLPPPAVLERQHVYHDCGKYLCLTIDENGKRHFPNHAAVSAEQFSRIWPDDGFTKQLIAHDMDFHTLRGDDLTATCNMAIAPILYFTAWAEINANAEMFGGRSSDSYKIKAKRLLQAGKKLLNH